MCSFRVIDNGVYLRGPHAVVKLVPEGVVCAPHEDVDPLAAPGDGRRVRGELPSEASPPSPLAVVVVYVPEGVVCAPYEDGEKAGTLRRGSRGRGELPAQRFPAPVLASVDRLDKANVVVLREVAVGAARAGTRPHE